MPPRCTNGTRRNNKTGLCDKSSPKKTKINTNTKNKHKTTRCTKGTRRNNKTGLCESKNKTA